MHLEEQNDLLKHQIHEMSQDIENYLEEINSLKFKVKQYEKALKFYADKESYEAWKEYENATGFFNNVDFDGGEKAKNILKEFSE